MLACSVSIFLVADHAHGQAVVFYHEFSAAKRHVNRSAELWKKGDYAGARRECNAALQLDPKSWAALINRAMVSEKEKNYDEALQDLNAAIRIEPSVPYTPFGRAIVYSSLAKYQLALINYENALRLKPEQEVRASINNHIGWLRATCPDASVRNGKRALAHARAAYHFSPRKADYIDTLAAAFAETGDFKEAVKQQERAASLAEDGKQRIPGWSERLALYRAGKPYRHR